MKKISSLLLIFLTALVASGATYYVVPNGAGSKDGTSWANAYADVQTAIDSASSAGGGEVWIAKGTYKHGSAMTMKNNVAIYGGFAGTETSKEERVAGNNTILDGEGKYRVFYNNYTSSNKLTNSAKLDNVTIQNGYSSDYGGGMYNVYASPEITNCTFTNNSATGDYSRGGGMYNSGSNPTLTNCTFANNSASGSSNSYGGGMYNSSSNPVLTNCTFSGNSASYGGGMYNYSPTSPKLTNCILWGNTASYSGNEIYNDDSNNKPTIDTCIIKGGYSSYGTYTNIITEDPKLMPLGNYGGSVQTCPVGAGSSAIGTGKKMSGVTTDARGFARSSTPTIGACELANKLTVASITTSEGYLKYSSTYEFTLNVYVPDSNNLTYQWYKDGVAIEGATLPSYKTSQDAGISKYTVVVSDGSSTITSSEIAIETIDVPRYYVSTEGSSENDGLTWATAKSDVQEAIDLASSYNACGMEVWIAKGTYKHGSAMTMKNGVAIYGGFAGTETSKDQRVADNNTILDGEGKYRVFYNNYTEENPLTNSAKLDNVTIQNGYASDGNNNSTSTSDCGAGIYNYYASPEITNCTFSGNSASDYSSGGGMCNDRGSSPVLTNCTFSNNSAYYGGGMCNAYSSPTLTNCTFSNNSASWGGGMYNGSSSPVLTNCTFSNNSASDYGGGMYNYNSSSPTLTNCTFSNNSAYYGGGMYNGSSSPVLTNCTFSNNSASDYGGGMYNSSSSPKLTNCILWGNTAFSSGNEIYNYDSSSKPTIDTCIIKGGKDGISGSDYCTFTTEPITAAPKLMPLGNYGGSVQTCPVGVGSSAIGAGKVVDGLTTDARGFARSSTPTIGACECQNKLTGVSITTSEGYLKYSSSYEFTLNVNVSDIDVTKVNLTYQWYKDGEKIEGATSSSYKTSQSVGTSKYTVQVSDGSSSITSSEIEIETVNPVIYVSTTGSSSNDGLSWATAKSDLQEAIDVASEYYGSEVWIAKGTYKHGSAMTMKNGVAIYGGFAGTETSKEERVAGNNTILDGEGKYGVFHNSRINSSAKLDNVTIQNGYTTYDGAGMSNYCASPEITNCTFSGNSASDYSSGGGMCNYSSSPKLTNCTFSNNIASNYGGGMYNNGYDGPCSPVLTNCTFSGNSASDYGSGGGMGNDYSANPTLINCTFSNNSASSQGGGIYNFWDSSPILINCILWGNTADWGNEIFRGAEDCNPTIYTCIIQGGVETINGNEYGTYTNIITADPKLMPLGNYGGSVQTCPVGVGSSAIGAGKVIEGITTDARGFARSTTTPTIGACEFIPTEITSHPTDIVVWANNEGATFTVSTSAENPTYQWQYSSNGSTWIDIENATSSTLTLSNVPSSQNGYQYRCGVDSDTTDFTYSSVAILTVKPAPSIATQPEALGIFTNNDGSLSVSASGEELTYQWYFNGEAIEGATSATLSFEKIQINQAGSYYCVISNPAGSVQTNAVNVVVKDHSCSLEVDKSKAHAGAKLTFTVTTDSNATQYNLYKGEDLVGSYTTNVFEYAEQNVGEHSYKVEVLFADGQKVVSEFVPVITLEKIFYVAQGATGDNDGTSWANAYADVQTAIDSAYNAGGGEVWIKKGTYKHGSAMTMKNNVAIYGGFAGTETSKDQRVAGNNTILDGEGKYSVFDNSYSSSNPLTNSAKLDNVTIQNGCANWCDGGGMYNNYASPEITNCMFDNNNVLATDKYESEYYIETYAIPEEYYYGAGMCNRYSNPTLINCTFSNNKITESLFSDDRYGTDGLRIEGGGAGMCNYISNPTLMNCSFVANSANWGGGMYNYNSSPTLTNCTFTNNIASDSRYNNNGGGMYNEYSSPVLTNCILWGNTALEDGNEIYNSNSSSNPTIDTCIIKEGYSSYGTYTNIITADPTLMPLGNYGGSVQTCPVGAGSSAIGAGKVVEGVTTDARGYFRPSRDNPTIGAYEYNPIVLPSITTQPTSVDIFLTNDGSLSVSVIGGDLTYQWYFNGEVIEGATEATLSFEDIQVGKAGSYYCVITNPAGSVQSNTVNVLVKPAPSISTQPESLDIFANADGSLSVSATGESLTYQWYFNGEAIEGATEATLSFEDIQANKAGSYFCVITNPAGSVQSNAVNVVVKPAPSIATQPEALDIFTNNDGSLSVSATGESLTYQWYFNGEAIEGATSATLSFENTQSDKAGSYYCVISNPAGSVQTNTVQVIVKDHSCSLEVDKSKAHAGAKLTFTVTTDSNATQYNLYKGEDLVGSYTTNVFEYAEQNVGEHSYKVEVLFADGQKVVSEFVPVITLEKIFYVAQNATGDNDGTSWANAYADVQTAIDSAYNAGGGEVWIAKGTYNHGSAMTMKNGVAIYGGFAGTEISKEERVSGNNTILDGEGRYRVFYNNYSSSNKLTNTAKLDNVTIQNGYASDEDDLITSNDDNGGGMYNSYSNPQITNCVFEYNSANKNGGGIYNHYSNPEITNCTFSYNYSFNQGGGVYNYYSSIVLKNCIFTYNSTGQYGGGISNYNSPIEVTNCTFYENKATGGSQGHCGGGMDNSYSSVVLRNCTFVDNRAGNKGGGISNRTSSPIITNCVFWNNESGLSNNEIYNSNSSSNPTIDTCIIKGGYSSYGSYTNIITADPKLMPLGNYGGIVQTMPVASSDSSAVYAGKALSNVTTDARGFARSTTAPTIGACEFIPTEIASKPEDISVWPNTDATFTVSSSVENATYQWQYSSNGTDWYDIEGEISSTLTLSNVPSSQNGYKYRCAVDSDKTDLTYSSVAILTVKPSPTLDNNPTGFEVYSNVDRSLSVSVTGEEITYQWYFNGKAIEDATDSTLSFENMQTSASGSYYCVITNPAGSVQSSSATVIVRQSADSTTITKPLIDVITASNNGYACFETASSAYGTLSYTWYYKLNTSSYWNKLSETSNRLTIANETSRRNAQIKCVISNAGGSAETIANLTYTNDAIVFATQPESAHRHLYGSASFAVEATTSTEEITYQWQKLSNGDWVDINGATNPTYADSYIQSQDLTSYRCKVGNGANAFAYSNTATLDNNIVISQQPTVSQTLWENHKFELSVESQCNNIGYQWQYSSDNIEWANIENATSNSFSVEAVKPSDAGYYRCVISGNNWISITSNVSQLAVKPIGAFTENLTGFEVYSNVDRTLSVSATGEELTYQWYFNGEAIDGATSSTLSFENMQTSASGSYYCVITNLAGSVQSSTAEVVVHQSARITKELTMVSAVKEIGYARFEIESDSYNPTIKWYIGGVEFTGEDLDENPKVLFFKVGSAIRTPVKCVVSTADGNEVTSQTLLICIDASASNAPIKITQQPVDTQPVAWGETASVATSATAVSTIVNYQWQISSDSETWENIEGANASTCSFKMEDYKKCFVRCEINDGNGAYLYSDVAKVMHSITPSEQTPDEMWLFDGDIEDVEFDFDVGEDGMKFQWQMSLDDGESWIDIENADDDLFYITMSPDLDGVKVRCNYWTATSQFTSNITTLHLATPVEITREPEVYTKAKLYSTVPLTVEATGYNLQYQWQISNDWGETWYDIDNATSSKLNVFVTEDVAFNYYRCYIYNKDEEGNVRSEAYTEFLEHGIIISTSEEDKYGKWTYEAGLRDDNAKSSAVPHNDGITNLEKFAFGLDASKATSYDANVNFKYSTDASGNASLQFPVSVDAEGVVNVEVLKSVDLISWDEVTDKVFVETSQDGKFKIYKVTAPVGEEGKVFLKLKVEEKKENF